MECGVGGEEKLGGGVVRSWFSSAVAPSMVLVWLVAVGVVGCERREKEISLCPLPHYHPHHDGPPWPATR